MSTNRSGLEDRRVEQALASAPTIPAPARSADRCAVAICTVGGVGLLRPAPGTWGSLAAALLALAGLCFLPADLVRPLLVAGAVAAAVLGVVCAPAAIRRWNTGDPSSVVIDEVAGQWLALAVLPGSLLLQPWIAVAAAFVLFRCFDILKPWPISWAERLPAGWGIVADDLVAGLAAGLVAATLVFLPSLGISG
jgi:phosphatidylglycerophosphatase A